MLKELRIEKYNNKFVLAEQDGNIRLNPSKILKNFNTHEDAINYVTSNFEVEHIGGYSYEKYYKPKYRDVYYTRVVIVEGIEITTEQVCKKIKEITGYIPAVIKHYRGRREGSFYQEEYLWENSVRSGTYKIDDLGNVSII